MKLLLVFPRMKYKTGDPPMGVCSLAAYVQKHTDVEVSVLDTTFHQDLGYVREVFRKEKPSIVGIYSDTLMFNDFVAVAKLARKSGFFVFAGGPHPTVMPDTVKPYVDMIVIGEGEVTITDVLSHFEKKDFENVKGIIFRKKKKWIKTPPREYVRDLDSLEHPALELVEMDKYMDRWHPLDSHNPNIRGTNVIASRGCPYNCSFCQPNLRALFGNIVRHRSPEDVVLELKELKEKFGIEGFFLQDDTFNIEKKWVKRFCSLLKSEKLNLLWGCNARVNTLRDRREVQMMYNSGLRIVHVGVESGSQRILNDIYQKGIKLEDVPPIINTLKDIGIHTLCFFMIGAPTETIDEIKKTIRFAVSLNATEITSTIVTPLPGSRLYDIMKNEYSISTDFSKFDYYKTRAFEDENISFRKLKLYQKEMLFRFYAHPKRWPFIFKHLSSPRGWKKMYFKIKRFW